MRDDFGRDAACLREKKLFLLDMDGTIYQENQLFPGTPGFLRQIRENGGRYVFITNNSSRSVTDYVDKLRGMGIHAGPEDFFTSSQAAARLLQTRHPGAKVYCQGTRSLIRELEAAGIDVTERVEPVDVVLVGFDTEITGEKLRNTSEILTTQDVPYYATNPDLRCPVRFGYVPDCGSMCIGLEYATGKTPVYIGKPEPAMIQIAMERFGAQKEETVVVGDRLYTDIAAGLNAGVDAVCVLSGEATLDDIARQSRKPGFVFADVGELALAISPAPAR